MKSALQWWRGDREAGKKKKKKNAPPLALLDIGTKGKDGGRVKQP